MPLQRLTAAIAILLGGMASLGVAQEKPASPEAWGSIEGQFVASEKIVVPLKVAAGANPICANAIPDESLVINPKNNGIANIFIYLRKAPAEVHPDLVAIPTSKVTSDQLNCQFLPHAMIVRVGQTVNCINSDNTSHNVHTNPVSGAASNLILQPKDIVGHDLKFDIPESLPVKVTCDIHGWMDCYWLVLDHPYLGMTDADGKFNIENLPAGEHSFRVWHERCGYVNREYKVNVVAGTTTTLAVEKVPTGKLAKR